MRVVDGVFPYDTIVERVVQLRPAFLAGSELVLQRAVNDSVVERGVRIADIGDVNHLATNGLRFVKIVGDGHGRRSAR